jgi:hypothetical protein
MPHHIFFSWQSDTPNRVGRSFIETCLGRTIGELQADADVDPADRDMAVDRDTRDVPGMPPVIDTIFGKIDRAAVFVSDLTYVAERAGGGRTPNPNVCIEHGYALKALSWRRVIAVMNTAMGHPDQHDLPFDVRHTRRPISFNLPEGADASARRVAADGLVRQLKGALKAVFGDTGARAGIAGAVPAEPHPHDIELLERVHRQLPLRLRQFLHQHSFGIPFLLATLDPIHEMNHDWVGAAFEFNDATVQTAFGEVRRVARQFGELVLERIYATRGNIEMGSPKTDEDLAKGIQPGTLQAIKEMDERATELSAAIDNFDRTARDRIRVASGQHAAAIEDKGAVDPARKEAAEAALNELAMDAHRGALPEIVTQPRVSLRLAPFAAADRRRLDPARVAEMQLRFPPNIEDRVATDSDGRQCWSCRLPRRTAPNMNPETDWRMRLVRPGYLEYEATIGARIANDPQILVDGRRLEAIIVRHLERMAGIAANLDLGGPALISMTFDGVEDVELTQNRPGGRRIRRPNIYLPVAQVDDLTAPLAEGLREQLDILWQTAGWSGGSPSFGTRVWAGYRDDVNYGL